jgi:hypothetical protein
MTNTRGIKLFYIRVDIIKTKMKALFLVIFSNSTINFLVVLI